MIIGEAGPSSSDGRAGKITPRRAEAQPQHRYIYYRLYTQDGAIESNNPTYSNDRFTSRVEATSVAPPHTGASLKRHLCRSEGFEELGNSSLYLSLTATIALNDSVMLSLRGSAGPGSSESEPMALVVETSAVEKRSTSSTVELKTLPERHEEPHYVFYRVYEKGGEVASKTSFHETKFSLGRIDTLSIPPPPSVSSLRSCLVKVEGIPTQDVQLCEDVYGESIMVDSDAISLFSAHYPGITEDEPLAIVYESQRDRDASKIQGSVSPQDPAFSKKIEVKPNCGWLSNDLPWHSRTVGEIFKTDGILRLEEWNSGTSVCESNCYAAINSAGKKAFVPRWAVDFC